MLAVHMTQLDEDDIRRVAKTGTDENDVIANAIQWGEKIRQQ